MSIAAVVFDLDGVIVASEEVWDDVRETYVRARGGHYDAGAQPDPVVLAEADTVLGSISELSRDVVARLR